MLWAPTSQPGPFWSTSPLLLRLLLMSSLLIVTVVSPQTSPSTKLPPANMYIVLDESASSAIDVCLEPRGAIQCPPPCPANSTTQCLYYLKESHKEEVCGRGLDDDAITDTERRRALNMLADIRMRHCCEHRVEQALSDDTFTGTRATCRNIIQHLLDIDHFIGRTVCGHARVLTRYDCTQVYSIVHRCEQCKVLLTHSLIAFTDSALVQYESIFLIGAYMVLIVRASHSFKRIYRLGFLPHVAKSQAF